jgi:hypothetical protein
MCAEAAKVKARGVADATDCTGLVLGLRWTCAEASSNLLDEFIDAQEAAGI